MIEHVWTLFCSGSTIDYESNNISLFNVLEQLTIRGEPVSSGVVPGMFEVVTLWARAEFDVPGRGRARLTFLSPSGPALDPVEYEVDLSQTHRLRQRSRLNGLPVREPGRHVFRVEFQNEGETGWNQVAAIPLEIRFEAPTAEGAGE